MAITDNIVKLSELPVADTLAGSEIIPVVQGGITKQTGMSQIAAIAKGDPGTPGAPGEDGADGRGIVNTLDNGDGTLTFVYTDGSTYVTPDLRGPEGIPGDAGTISVGTVTTGEPGSAVGIFNSGTSSDAILDFTIPAGATGAPGDTGPAGNGIVDTTDNGDGTLTFTYSDASTFTTPNLQGPPGVDGEPGPPGLGTGLDVTDFIEAGDNGDLGLAIVRALAVSDNIAIPGGTYTVNTPFEYPNGMNFTGAGFNPTVHAGPATIINAPNGLMYNPQADDVTPANSVRRRFLLRGIKVVGAGVGSAITGPFGGLIEECAFSGYERAIRNGASYLSRYVRCNFGDCSDIALSLADANGVRIEDCFMDATCKVAVSILDEIPQSSGGTRGSPIIISGNNVNMKGNQYTNTTAMKLRGNILLEGNYFECYPAGAGATGNQFVELEVGQDDACGFTCINNEFNGQSEMANAIRVQGQTTLKCEANASITRNRFLGMTGFDVVGGRREGGYGWVTNVRFFDNGGNPTIGGFADIATYRPMFQSHFTTPTSVAGATLIRLPIAETVLINNTNSKANNTTYQAKKDGLYRVTAEVTFRTTASDYRNLSMEMEVNSTPYGPGALVGLIHSTTGDTYVQATISRLVNLVYGDNVQISARNGEDAYRGTFSVEYLEKGWS